jgi:hypothetical protein
VRFGHALRPHLEQLHGKASASELIGGFCPGQTTAYYADEITHLLIPLSESSSRIPFSGSVWCDRPVW